MRQYNRCMSLPAAVYSTAQVRALDRYAIEVQGVPGYVLMERAARASLFFLQRQWPGAQRLTVVCGGGNNGGDGYVLARLAQAAGLSVSVMAGVLPDKLQGDARRAWTDWLAANGRVTPFDATALAAADVIVDALCGIGLQSDLRSEAQAIVAAVNAAGRPVLALDVPSGLCSDTGRVLGAAIVAAATVCFVGLKQGLFLGAGPRLTGVLAFDALDIVAPASPDFAPRMTRLTRLELTAAFAPRPRDAHKGLFGEVLVIGGGAGMPGAAALAARAALRVGAGRVRVACAPDSAAAIASHTPEVMVSALPGAAGLQELLAGCSIVLLGPGLGTTPWARGVWLQTLQYCREHSRPLVLDADALNLLAEDTAALAGCDAVLTPHPGEAARLAGSTSSAVQDDRLGTLDALCRTFSAVVVLKGACTLIGAVGQTPSVCSDGNPGMATAGMGDVLAGAVAGLLAQIRDPWQAARLAVLAHALAGDVAAAGGERGLLASDVVETLRLMVNR